MKNIHYKRVKNRKPARSLFDLSYTKTGTGDFNMLYPIMCDLVMPGDFLKIGADVVIRFMPQVAPILHQVDIYLHYWEVPLRLLWNAKTREELEETGDWEEFITGGIDGDNADTMPVWDPTDTTIGSLWDYFGFPVAEPGPIDPAGVHPADWPRRAYNLVVNENYIDETFDTPNGLQDEAISPRRVKKDYFTSALPWQQRGTAVSLPLGGTTSAVWDSSNFSGGVITYNDAYSPYFSQLSGGSDIMHVDNATSRANARLFMNSNEVDISSISTFDIADLRLAFQIQRWMERNARAGARYIEFLGAHFGVHPRDDRLQRPSYIGGMRVPIIESEVLQTESSDASTPQGTLAGHGIGVGSEYCGKVHVQEFGVILGLMSVCPKHSYASQGIDRQWLQQTKYDFPFPEFVNLSEQAILNGEIFVTDGDGATNIDIFGYQGRYNEHRSKNDQICGLMRTDFDYWHMNRIFDSVPTLNSSFLSWDVDLRNFAATEEPPFVFKVGNRIHAWRPLPIIPEPGMVDH